MRFTYKIYQIDSQYPENMFMNYNFTKSHGGVKAREYTLVYGSVISCDSPMDALEEIFIIFNQKTKPDKYCGRSVSVSDVISLTDERAKTEYYFCDRFGFKKLEEFNVKCC